MSIIVLEGSNGVGKSSIAKIISDRFDIISKKSVPDWFRKYINFARKCPLEIQKEIYKIGHDANYFSCTSVNDYIFDRYFYTTIIRINYELKISVDNTVKEILSYKNIPDIVFIIRSSINEIKIRLNERENHSFNLEFYIYENKVFEQLSKKNDIIYMITNSDNNIESAVYDINNIIDSKLKIRKR